MKLATAIISLGALSGAAHAGSTTTREELVDAARAKKKAIVQQLEKAKADGKSSDKIEAIKADLVAAKNALDAAKASESPGGSQCEGVYICDGFILRYKYEGYQQEERADKFEISTTNPTTDDPLEPGFFMMRRINAEKDDDLAMCTIKPWDDGAICAETMDSELKEVHFAKDCASFDVIIYTAHSTIEGEYPHVKKEHCTLE